MQSVEDEEDLLLYKLHTEFSKNGKNLLALRAYKVVDFSSQYGSEDSLSYTADNMLGKPIIFPHSGDHAYSFQLRTYGSWWLNLPSNPKTITILPYGCPVESQDFIEFLVEKRVVPVHIRIYEIYNPGAIIKILAYCYDAERWVILWQGNPRLLPPNESHCCSIQFEGVNFLSDYYRIEFHHKHLNYYCEFDGVVLYGEDKFPLSFPSYNLLGSKYPKSSAKVISSSACNGNLSTVDSVCVEHSLSYFDTIPREVISCIINYLDLKSLCTASRVSRLFQKLCYDPVLYKDLNLQLYWHLVDVAALKGLESRLESLKRLNLSWCGGQGRITPPYFIEFLETRCQYLTTLKLSCCPFVNNNCIKAVAHHCPYLQELQMQCCRAKDLTQTGFKYISHMTNLTFLDLYRTLIDKASILTIIRCCVKLEHLFLGSCVNIHGFNDVTRAISKNLKYIKSLDLWRATSLSCLGIFELAEQCHDLIELDLGWCYKVDASCGCVRQLIGHCHKLKKLVLTAIRTISDSEVNTIAARCREIEQLDILGTVEVSLSSVKNLLQSCKKLKLLDVSYCENSVKSAVSELQQNFPSVEIKCSIPPKRMHRDSAYNE